MTTRILYQQDGSQVFGIDTSGHVQFAPWSFDGGASYLDAKLINDADNTTSGTIPGSWGGTALVGVLLSIPWSISAYYFGVESNSGQDDELQISTDSTNGLDGEWTTIVGPTTASPGGAFDWRHPDFATPTPPPPDGMILYVQTLGAPTAEITAVRVQVHQGGFLAGTVNIFSFHLYGTPSSNYDPMTISPQQIRSHKAGDKSKWLSVRT